MKGVNGWTIVENKKQYKPKKTKPITIDDDTYNKMTLPERALLSFLQKAEQPLTAAELAAQFKKKKVTEQMVANVLYGDKPGSPHKTLCEYVENMGRHPTRWRLKRV